MSDPWSVTRLEELPTDSSFRDKTLRPDVQTGLLRLTASHEDPWHMARGMLTEPPNYLHTPGPQVYIAALWRAALGGLMRVNNPGVQEWALAVSWLLARGSNFTTNKVVSAFHAAAVALRPRTENPDLSLEKQLGQWDNTASVNRFSYPDSESFPQYISKYDCDRLLKVGVLYKPKPTEWKFVADRLPLTLPPTVHDCFLFPMPSKEVESSRQTRSRQVVVGWSWGLMINSIRPFHHALSAAMRINTTTWQHGKKIAEAYSGVRAATGTQAFASSFGNHMTNASLVQFDNDLAHLLFEHRSLSTLDEWLNTPCFEAYEPVMPADYEKPGSIHDIVASSALRVNNKDVCYVPRVTLPTNRRENY